MKNCDFFLIFAQNIDRGYTLEPPQFLTSTHNLCFEQNKKNIKNISSENYRFYSREILQYIARTCLRNDNKHWLCLPEACGRLS